MVILFTEAASVLAVSLNSDTIACFWPTLGLASEPTLFMVIPPLVAPETVTLFPETGKPETVPDESVTEFN